MDVVDICHSTRAQQEGEIDWMCPVCGLEYDQTAQIRVDGLVAQLLAELDAEDPEGIIRAVNLSKDGSWAHVSGNPEERLPMRRKKRARLTLDQARAVVGERTVEIDSSGSEDGSSNNDHSVDVIDLEDSD